MPSIGGITEIIGVRAVIIDVRQFLADGREIERTVERIGVANKKVETASKAVVAAENAKFAATTKANNAAIAAVKARERVLDLEKQIAAAQTKTASTNSGLVGPNGQPIASTASNQAAVANVTKLKQELKLAQQEYNDLARVAQRSARVEAVAGTEAVAASRARVAALEQETRLNEQLAAAQRSRIKAAASGVALVGTAAIAGIAGASITQAAKYEQELSKINVLTSATDAQTAELGKQFLQLSTQIPVSASDLAGAAYKVLSSGIKDTGVALDITTQSAKAATAGQADIKDIVSATIAVMNSYPKGAINAAQANDILFAGVKEGNAEFNDFAGSLGKVIPIAAALGVPFDQLTASLAVLTNGGLNAEEAATGLRAILNDLAKDEGSKQARDALAAVGLTVEQLRKNIAEKGLPQAMGELLTLFKGNLAAIEPIIPNIRGMVAAFSAFSDGGKTAAGVLTSIDKSAGIVNQSFEKTKNNTANLAKIFSNELNVAFIEIGQAVLPEVNKALKDLITFLQNNRQEIADFVAQGLQAIIDIGKGVVEGISAIVKVLSALDDIFKSIVGNSAATKAALAAIGVGLAWALPGGPTIVGLTSILFLLGQIQGASKGKNSTGRAIVQGAATALGGIGGGLLGAASFTPFGVGAGALGGAAIGGLGGKALADLLFGPEESKNIQTATNQIGQFNQGTQELGDINLPKLNVNIGGVNKAAQDASEKLKKLAQDFLKTSEAAGEVESFTAEFKKFGTISKQLADAAGLSAAQAGAVQGVDAVIRAQERSQAEAFNYVEAINAVSQAYRQSAAVGRELLLDLANASLEASQKALEGVFSRPTREVANLNVDLARRQVNTAQINARNSPQIVALQRQLRDINQQISQNSRNNSLANRAAERAKRDADRALKEQQKQQQAALDQLKLANLIAGINAERQLAALQKLIDANNKAASDLNEAFLKSNDALQKQINEAIGRGDSKTALSLVDQQRQQVKQYRAQQKALQDSTQQLTAQQKAAQEAEQERQRQAKLAEALADAQNKQKDSTDDLSDSLDDAKAAQDAQTEALNNSRDAIQAQIDALQEPIDAAKDQEKAIQDQIAVYEAQTNVLKALGVAADKTLLTQAQQATAAQHFTEQVAFASGYAQTLAKSFYDFIPGAKDADLKFKTLNGAIDAVNGRIDPSLLVSFDAAKARLDLLAKATEDVTATFNNTSTQTKQNAADVQKAISDSITEQERILAQTQSDEYDATAYFGAKVKSASDDVASNISKLPDAFGNVIEAFKKKVSDIDIGGILNSIKKRIPGLAVGGIVTRPTLSLIGESGPEAVLPLNDPRRIGQILSQAVGAGTVGTAYGNLSPASTGYPTIGPTGSGLVGGGLRQPLNSFDLYFGPRDNRRYGSPMVVQMPSSLTAALSTAGKTSTVFAPNISVQGETLDTMEAAALRAVQSAFRDARTISSRSGGLITQGLGPNH